MVGHDSSLPPASERYYAREHVTAYVCHLAAKAKEALQSNETMLKDAGVYDMFCEELELIAAIHCGERASEHHRLHDLNLAKGAITNRDDPWWSAFPGYPIIAELLNITRYKANGIKIPRHEVDIPAEFLH